MKSALAALLLLVPIVAHTEEPKTFEEKCTSTEASSNQGDANFDVHVFDVENKCEFSIRCDLNIAVSCCESDRATSKVVDVCRRKVNGPTDLAQWIGESTEASTQQPI